MTVDLISLAIIALVAAVCPIIAKLVPRNLVPETVLLLIAGALLGPHAMHVIALNNSVSLLSDLGLAFLFLLAGYEINPKSLTGKQGKRGLATWIISFAIAFAVMYFIPTKSKNHFEAIAMPIVLTTTALGTLIPILKERELSGTQVGKSVLEYGTWGELCPILAMTVLLSSRAEWRSVTILFAFAIICVVAAVVPARAKKAGHRMFGFLTENAEGTSQTMMRVTVLLLVGLVALSAALDLDIVLGGVRRRIRTALHHTRRRSRFRKEARRRGLRILHTDFLCRIRGKDRPRRCARPTCPACRIYSHASAYPHGAYLCCADHRQGNTRYLNVQPADYCFLLHNRAACHSCCYLGGSKGERYVTGDS